MPQGKKKGRANNKKKKGNDGSRAPRGPNIGFNSSPATGSGPSPSSTNVNIEGNLLRGKAPNFDKFERRQALQENYKSVYSRYKDATNRFFQYMIQQTPEDVRGKPSVNALVVAADWMVEQGHPMDAMILKDLKLAIRIRSRVAKSVYGGGDSSHKHFISVLVYCWTLLVSLPRQESTTTRISEDEESEMKNRYDVFLDEDDEDDGGEDEEIFPSSPVARPEPTPEPMSFEEIMASEDRHDATLFLLTLDEHMKYISDQYQCVLKNHNYYKSIGAPESALIEEYLEAAVATNMAIQHIQHLEMELQVQHPHLTTPYRALATIVLPEITHTISTTVREHSAKYCSEKEILIFLGDCFECNFRAPSDPLNRKDTIMQDFCRQFDVSTVGAMQLEKTLGGLEQIMILEVPIAAEKPGAERLRREMQSQNISAPSHAWLKDMPFIGGDRAIHHTVRLLQQFGTVVYTTPENKKVSGRRGWFGSTPWRSGCSSKIHGDLDELFMFDILPDWILMCRRGVLGNAVLPFENELYPLFVLLRNYVKNPEKPVSWAFAFAMHALLTAVLETDKIIEDLMLMSKTVFDNYFSQVDWAMTLSKSEKDAGNAAYPPRIFFQISFLSTNLGIANEESGPMEVFITALGCIFFEFFATLYVDIFSLLDCQ